MLIVQTQQGSTNWSLHPEEKLITITHHGLLTSEHLIENLHKLKENHSLPRNLKVLQDAREAHFMFDISHMQQIVAEFTLMAQAFEHIRWADVHSSPKTTAYSYLFANSLPHTGDAYRLFSSPEEAMNWLTFKQELSIKGVVNT
jgi:hypothetical protein